MLITPIFVLYLPHHDAGLARMSRHPVQNASRRTHGISTVELHAGCRASHSHRRVAAQHGVSVLSHRKRPGKRLEIRRGVIVAGTCDSHVFSDDGFAFLLELLSENLFQGLEAHAHHAQARSDRERVLGDLVAGDVGQF